MPHKRTNSGMLVTHNYLQLIFSDIFLYALYNFSYLYLCPFLYAAKKKKYFPYSNKVKSLPKISITY